jgi:hypothetical protein
MEECAKIISAFVKTALLELLVPYQLIYARLRIVLTEQFVCLIRKKVLLVFVNPELVENDANT